MPWVERALGLCAAREVDLQMSIVELVLSELQDLGFCYCCCIDLGVTDLGREMSCATPLGTNSPFFLLSAITGRIWKEAYIHALFTRSPVSDYGLPGTVQVGIGRSRQSILLNVNNGLPYLSTLHTSSM